MPRGEGRQTPVQGTHPADNLPDGWTELAPSGRGIARLCAWLAAVLFTGRDATGFSEVGTVDTPSVAGNNGQAVAGRPGDVPRAEEARRLGCGSGQIDA